MTYRERKISEITIKRGDVDVVSVLISEASRRKFSLMGEDSVTLVFSLPEPLHFMVGDSIDDDLFGRFLIREQQMPKYNTTTGGYDYQLRFDSDYWIAENHILMLTTGGVVNQNDGVWSVTGDVIRKEVSWNLTGRLEDHALMVIRNYKALCMQRPNAEGVMSDYTLVIDGTATHAGESKHLAYDGIGIISALTQMANEFECEWWFEGNELHFGKCGGEGDADIDFYLGDHEHGAGNVESMDISRNQNTYANRLYVLGGTNNIPDSYRRRLILTIDTMRDDLFCDSTKRVEQGMLRGDSYGSEDKAIGLIQTEKINGPNDVTITKSGTFTMLYGETLSWTGIVGSAHVQRLRGGSCEAYLTLRVDGAEVGQDTLPSHTIAPSAEPEHVSLRIDGGSTRLGAGEHTVEIKFHVIGGQSVQYDAGVISGTLSYKSGASKKATLRYDGTEYVVTFNPNSHTRDSYEYWMFKFDGGTPIGFGAGRQAELLGYDPAEIPFSWYTDDTDDPSTMLSLGERRLRLPESLGREYVQIDGLTEGQIIEEYVKADKIYPKCYLKVTSVVTESRDESVQYSDGSKRRWQWTAFTVEAMQITGAEFPFRTKYVREGDKLQAVFLSEMDEQNAYDEYGITPPTDGDRWLLAGMTFDVSFSNGKYTLIRNEDYGAKLPNLTLCPKVGDVFVLTGWDVKNMEELNLISEAENNLYKWAMEYLGAIEEGQWTFTCHMMSDWPFILFGDHQYDSEWFHDAEDKPVDDEEERPFHVLLGRNKYGYVPFRDADTKWFFTHGEQFYVRNTEYYILPTEGARVRIIHNALPDGTKESRIIGYELKLDKPYDSPTYTVGETEAYSRIKQLENKLNQR